MNDKMVEDNLALVHACCKRFRNRGIEYEELYSAGCMGLVKAVNRFNPDLKLQLSTYAVPVILGEIKRLFRDGGTVKVSRSLKELSLKINSETKKFTEQHDRTPTVEELSKILGEPEEKIADAINSARYPLSLTNSYEDDDNRQIDLPADDIMEKLTEKLALNEVLKLLNREDKKIIELRYFKYQTQCETAKALNMTQVQVSRREKKILLFLREKLA
ncbi:MAG: sigma-70 family RNA polymerase sigma factor [Ruminococcus sp.]|jgi:RNA polymerase sporulation-specific sigma factor|nr:sigma-70 family RNA polymerase sigma factor [Ruminococcus sp.]